VNLGFSILIILQVFFDIPGSSASATYQLVLARLQYAHSLQPVLG
jgi:hypothetical protein